MVIICRLTIQQPHAAENLMHAFLGWSHKFPAREELELDEMPPKR